MCELNFKISFRVFVNLSNLSPSIIFAGKAGANQSGAPDGTEL